MTFLNIDQHAEELKELYGERDYYWYLRSPQFREQLLSRVAEEVDALGAACLDVCCGEACLGDMVHVPYAGFDGSITAVDRALRRSPQLTVCVGRLEDPPTLGEFGTLVFGGVLEVLVLPESRVDLLRLYAERYRATHAVVCDLDRLSTVELVKAFGRPLREFSIYVGDIDLLEAKRRRKVWVFQL